MPSAYLFELPTLQAQTFRPEDLEGHANHVEGVSDDAALH